MTEVPSRIDTTVSLVTLLMESKGTPGLPSAELEVVLNAYVVGHPEDPTLAGLLIQLANFAAYAVGLYAEADKLSPETALRRMAIAIAKQQ